MDGANAIGEVLPCYGRLRRTLLPIYGIDQLVFAAVVALPFICLAWVNPKLALYIGIGAYIGFVVTMQRSTPSSVLLSVTDEPSRRQNSRPISLLRAKGRCRVEQH